MRLATDFSARSSVFPWFLTLYLKIDSVELALSGHGAYLGITDKNKLMSQLEVLQTKEAQLQKKELLIMGGALRPPYSEGALFCVSCCTRLYVFV